MLRGLLFQTPELEYNVGVSGSTSASPAAITGVSGEISGFWHNDYLLTILGFKIVVSLQFNPFGTNSSGAVLSGQVGSQSRTYGAATSIGSTLHFYNVSVYVEPSGSLRLVYSSVEWKVNGTSEWTGGSFDGTASIAACAGAIPRIGVAPYLNGGVIVPIFVPLSPGGGVSGSGSYSGTATVTGGFRWKDSGGTWVTLPIALTPPGSMSAPGTPTGSTCYAVSIPYSTTANSDGTTYANNVIEGGDCWIWPNNPGEVVRMNDDYEATVYRGSLGQWQYKATDVVTTTQRFIPPPPDPPVVVVDNSIIGDIQAAESEFLARVTNSANIIEGPITDTRYAPWTYQISDDYWDNTERITDVKGYTSIHSVGSSNLVDYDHAEAFVRLWNTWFHPHGLYSLWMPPDTAATSVRWPINGTPANLADYWYPARQQWINHPSLPSGDNTQRRTDIVAEPIDQSSIIGLAESLTGSPGGFWGIERFIAENTAWLTEIELDDQSNSRWTFDGTGTRQVTATRFEFSANSVEAEFDLSSYTAYPYMVPVLARNVELSSSNWSNVASVKIEVEDATGKITELVAAAVTGGNWDIPAELSTKWHTSLAQNLGDSGFLVDTYDDVAATADDYSGTIAASNTLSPTQHGSKARSYGTLRVTITKTNPAASATLGLITLNLAPRAEWHTRRESAHGATVLSENGPLFRTQSLRFFDYLLDTPLSTPDAVGDLVAQPTIGDWLAFRRAFLEARDAQDAVLTEALSYFVNNEEITIVDHLWRDPSNIVNSTSFFAQGANGPVPIILNSYRAMPPLALFPIKKKTAASNWTETGTYGQYMYSLVANRRNIITTEVADIRLDFPGDVLTPEVSPPAGWEVEYHTSQVTNSEGYDAHLILDTTEYLRMRPWRGGLIFPYESQVVGDSLSYDVSRSWRHAQSYRKDGNLWIRASSTNAPYTWTDVDTGIAVTFARIAYSRGLSEDALFLLTVESGSVILRKTTDEGATNTTMATIGTGNYGALVWTPNNLLWIFRLESGTIYARALDAGMNTVYSESATNVTGVDDVAFDVKYSVDSSNKTRLGILYTDSGVLNFVTSFDGYTYS